MKTTESGVPSPEDRILKAYADKLDQSYFSGYNRIDLTVRRGTAAAMRPCLAGMAAAFIFYALLSAVISADTEKMILQDIISPLEKLFINAVIMVGTPIRYYFTVYDVLTLSHVCRCSHCPAFHALFRQVL